MKKKFLTMAFLSLFTFNCATAKPSWERKDRTQVTQNDEAVLGVIFSLLAIYVLQTFTTK